MTGDQNAWRKEAGCKNIDVDDFFPSNKEIKKIRAAKAVCRRCPVRKECLQYALENNLEGIFGGTTLSERQFMAALMPGLRTPVSEHVPLDIQSPEPEQKTPETTYISGNATLLECYEIPNQPGEPDQLVLLEYDIHFDVELEDP